MENHTSTVHSHAFSTWQQSVPEILEAAGLGKICAAHERILIKPNLVEILAPPITTPYQLVDAVVDYLLNYVSPQRLLVGEGCGATHHDTYHAFQELGYTRIAEKRKITLLDLNTEELTAKQNPECTRWPEMYLPKILDEVFILSVPQLKAHSLSTVTLTMKNMMGCAPPSHYRGSGSWNKAAFHTDIHEAVFDLNRYRTPDFSLIDATIGMAQAHLWGPRCDPPVGRLVASFDPVAVDSHATSLLGRRWQDVGHIYLAHKVLGFAEGFAVEER